MPKMPTCPQCELFIDICICSQILPVASKTRISFVVNRKEVFKITNTAKLAFRILNNSDLHIYGNRDQVFDPGCLAQSKNKPLLLFPCSGAKVLSQYTLPNEPIHLIVPDGNWKQARKIARKVMQSIDVLPVKLSNGRPSEYKIRFHPDPEKVSTIEAVSRALVTIESDFPSDRLLNPFRLMRDRLLRKCGKHEKLKS